MGVEVSLGTYVLPLTHKVWKYFPGKNYKFHDLVSETSVALLDVRDLDEVNDDPAEWEDDALLEHIAEDRVERRVEAGAPRPAKTIKSAGDKTTLTFLKGLFYTAKKGDLIVMPDKGYTTQVRIGILTDKAGKLKKITAKDNDGTYNYFGRRVRWVGSIEKRKLSDELIGQLHSQAAFFDLGRSHYEEIYDKAFDDYAYDGQFVGTFRTAKSIFTPKDNFLTSVWLELLEVLEEARENKTDLQAGSIYSLVIDSDIDEDDRDDLSISVQSPGWFRVRSIVVAPLASLAMFAMAVNNVPFNDAIAATVTAKIVPGADGDCLGDVDESVRDYIKLLGADRWEEACKLAKRAELDAKLSVAATVEVAARKEEE